MSRAVNVMHWTGGTSVRTDFDEAIRRLDSADAALADKATRILVELAAMDAERTERRWLPSGSQRSWARGVWA